MVLHLNQEASRAHRLVLVAQSQHGLITRAQALAAGYSSSAVNRLSGSGVWQSAGRGVWRLIGAPVTWRQLVLAAVLSAGDDAVASHRTAARLWGLDGWVSSDPLELSVPKGSQFRRRGLIAYGTRRLAARNHRHGIAVTGLPRTLIDLGSVLERPRLESVLDSALRTRPWLPRVLQRELHDSREAPVRGQGVLRAMLDARDEPTDSELEVLVERELRTALLWGYRMHHDIGGPEGFVANVDFAWLEQRVAVQCHGFRYHGEHRRWQRDQEQLRALTALGWAVVPITWHDITRRAPQTLGQLTLVLQRRTARPLLGTH